MVFEAYRFESTSFVRILSAEKEPSEASSGYGRVFFAKMGRMDQKGSKKKVPHTRLPVYLLLVPRPIAEN
jgi:hypothetical protein